MKKVWGKFLVGLVLCGLLCYGGLAQAATTWKVCKEGWCNYTSIKIAIEAPTTVNGDTVLVSGGTYVENINFLGKAITVWSVNGAANTTIDGNASGSVVTFWSYEGVDSVLDGFTITNGSAFEGGGIFCWESSPTITNCIISGNTAGSGGGIRCGISSPVIINCTIIGNTADGDGGGIDCYQSSPTIINCTISGNTANMGGGIRPGILSSPTVINSILWGNSPDEIYLYGGSTIDATYSDIQGGWAGVGNINTNPKFVGGGNYHLTAGSPCIDTGNNLGIPADDIDGDVRPQGTDYDMGSDEFVGVPVSEPWVSISTDKPSYTTGETMGVRLEVTAGDLPALADVYIRIVFPWGGPVYYYPSWTTTPTPVVSLWTVTDWGPAVFFDYTFGGGIPDGEYTWDAALTEAGTANIIDISSAPFTFSP